MKMANGGGAHYESTCSAAGHQNNWYQEYYRAMCEKGDLVIDNDDTVRMVSRDNRTGAMTTEEVPLAAPAFEGHNYIIDAHLEWIGRGSAPETVIDDNIYSNAAMFAAIEASAKGKSVDVEAMAARVTRG